MRNAIALWLYKSRLRVGYLDQHFNISPTNEDRAGLSPVRELWGTLVWFATLPIGPFQRRSKTGRRDDLVDPCL